MLRGFVTGGAWGLIVATLGVTTASLLAPQPPGNTPPTEPLVMLSEVVPAEIATDPPVTEPGAADPVLNASPPVTTLDLPVPAADADAGIADTTPSDPPVVATAEGLLIAPAEVGTSLATIAPDSPVLPNPQAPAPVIPVTEADLVLSTEPAAPPPPQAPSLATSVTEPIAVIPVPSEAVQMPVVVAQADVAPDAAPATGPLVVQEAAPVTDTAAQAPQPSDPAPAAEVSAPAAPQQQAAPEVTSAPVLVTDADTAPANIAPVPQVLPEALPEQVPEIVPEGEPELAPESQTTAQVAPDVVPLPEVITLAPQIAQTAPPPARIVLQGDAGSLPQVAGGVRVNRPEAADAAAQDAAIDAAAALDIAVVTEGPALVQFAAPFSNPDNKPLMSLILIDDGTITGLSDTLTDVPFPVTIAINPEDPDATERMQAFRDRGIEVLAIAKLPAGAQPSDVEVTLEAVFAVLPQAVGLIDIGDGEVQSSAAVTGQTLARLGADGRGLVVFSNGLNPGLRAAATAGVPAVEVARDLDGNGQDAATIRRFLDNAAFQARQQSGIVLLARLRPETISALILWGSENRAGQVVLTPISATLSQ